VGRIPGLSSLFRFNHNHKDAIHLRESLFKIHFLLAKRQIGIKHIHGVGIENKVSSRVIEEPHSQYADDSYYPNRKPLASTDKSEKQLTIAISSRSEQCLPSLLGTYLFHPLYFNLSAIAIKESREKNK
jgi:hypothetical protein